MAGTNAEVLCNRMDPEIASCRGCNVPSILRAVVEHKKDVDDQARRVSQIYCPEESGGIDKQTTGTIYNYLPAETQPGDRIW